MTPTAGVDEAQKSNPAPAHERREIMLHGTHFVNANGSWYVIAGNHPDMAVDQRLGPFLDRIAELEAATSPRDNLECPCGNTLRRDGETVKSHWNGSICEDCEAGIWRKHPANQSPKIAEANTLLDKEADLMAAWVREMADDASMSDEDSGSLMAAASLIQKLRARVGVQS